MCPSGSAAYYLRGVPDGVHGAPPSVEMPWIYESERGARAELGLVMLLSRMVHGDLVADSTSWYLQAADVDGAARFREDVTTCLGYRLDDHAMHAVAGGWSDTTAALAWAPFVRELERRRAQEAGLPWRPDSLELFRALDGSGAWHLKFSAFRFTPVWTELLVRPLNIYMTEPLF